MVSNGTLEDKNETDSKLKNPSDTGGNIATATDMMSVSDDKNEGNHKTLSPDDISGSDNVRVISVSSLPTSSRLKEEF